MERRLSVKILILTVFLPCVKVVAESHVGDSITCTETECDENEHEDGGVGRQTLGEDPMQKTQVHFRSFGRLYILGHNLNLAVLWLLDGKSEEFHGRQGKTLPEAQRTQGISSLT